MDERPYAFVSYSHKDSDVVLPILELLQARGLRLWYDSGIEVGSEWPEYIASALMGSSCVIAFVSPRSIESQNCRREVNFAIDEKKDMLVAYLEPTELSPGMKLQLNTIQATFRENYANDEAFADVLLKASLLSDCIEVPEPAPQAEPEPANAPAAEPEPGAAASPGQPTPLGQPASVKQPEPAGSPAAETEPGPEPEVSPAPASAGEPASDHEPAPKPKSRLKVLIIAILAVLVAAVLLRIGIASCMLSSSKGRVLSDEPAVVVAGTKLSDSRLAGLWNLVSIDNVGEVPAKLRTYGGTTLGITLDGKYFGTLFEGFEDALSSTALKPLGTMEILEDGTLELSDIELALGNAEKFDISQVSYELGEFTQEELEARSNLNDTQRAYLLACPESKLVIHIEGTYAKGPTSTQPVDVTLTLQRDEDEWYCSSGSSYPDAHGCLLAETMVGTWVDGYGNEWTFGSTIEGVVSLSLKAANDSELVATSVYMRLDDDKDGWLLDVVFDDEEASIRKARADSIQWDTVAFTQSDGSPLVLTRAFRWSR